MAPLSLHLRTTWAQDPSFWDLLFHLTHHLLNHPYPPKAYKSTLISMVEREQGYVVALTLWPKSVG